MNYSLTIWQFNLLNAKLYPICNLLALLGAHHILHVSRLRVKVIIPTDQKVTVKSLSTPQMHTWGVEVYLHSFLTSATDGGEWVNFTPLPRYTTGKTSLPIEQEAGWSPEPRYPLNRRLGGPQSRSWKFWRTEKSLVTMGIRTPDHPARSLVTKLNALLRLLPSR